MERKVGFIGLGTMGYPMAVNILKANGQLLVSDVIQEVKDRIAAIGADVATDNQEVFVACDIVFLSLPNLKVVESVTNEMLEVGHKGQYVIDTSTIGFKMSVEIGEKAAELGIQYIDTPISGGAGRAADGTLSIISGMAADEAKEAGVFSLYKAIGREVHYTNSRGGGVALKIINNMLSKAILFATGEAVLIAEHMGIPFETLYEVIQSSSSQNEMFRIKKEHIQNHSYEKSNKSYSPITMSLKDLKLARELCDELQIASFSCNNVIQWYEMGMQRGYAEKDSSSLVELIRELQPPKNA